MAYSFELRINKYHRNTTLKDRSEIYVSGICVIAKNAKFGKFYFSKYITKRTGKFSYAAGSQAYPILYPITDCVLHIENFPKPPVLDKFHYHEGFDQEYLTHIKIENIYPSPPTNNSNRDYGTAGN